MWVYRIHAQGDFGSKESAVSWRGNKEEAEKEWRELQEVAKDSAHPDATIERLWVPTTKKELLRFLNQYGDR